MRRKKKKKTCRAFMMEGASLLLGFLFPFYLLVASKGKELPALGTAVALKHMMYPTVNTNVCV